MNKVLQSIQIEKEIAKQFLEHCKKMFGNATLAGGAPRDWFLGKSCRDLDVYVVGDCKDNETMLREFFGAERLGTDIASPEYEEVRKLKDLGSAWQCEFMRIPCNIIFLNGLSDKVYDHFDSSICKIIWLEDTNTFDLSDDFSKTLETKVIKVYQNSKRHFDKLVNKFGKEYTFDFSELGKEFMKVLSVRERLDLIGINKVM